MEVHLKLSRRKKIDELDVKKLLDESVDDTLNKMKGELNERLQEAASYSTHLTNVISGINHEVSPWISRAINTADRLNRSLDPEQCGDCKVTKKLEEVIFSLQQSLQIMNTLSANVRQLKDHSTTVCSLQSTIDSWVTVTLLDRYVKEMIDSRNIVVESDSLDFEVTHPPMYLAQIIFNLAKNSIDHNSDMLDELVITIRGDKEAKCLIFEDNGKGIDPEIQDTLFNPGVTTKCGSVEQHGLGLSACMDYCIIMNAVIICDSVQGSTKFIIYFDKSFDGLDDDQNSKKCYQKKMDLSEKRMLIEKGGYGTIRRVSGMQENGEDR
jgi:signal transduction histidine kinase